MSMLQVGKHADLKLQQHSELRTSRTDHFHNAAAKTVCSRVEHSQRTAQQAQQRLQTSRRGEDDTTR